MLEIGWGKLVLIGIVALLVIGPKELPAVLRTMGQWMTKLRRMAAEFQSQFQEAMREAELAELKKQVDEVSSTAQSYSNFDPLSDVRREFETTQRQIENAVNAPPVATNESTEHSGTNMPAGAATAEVSADAQHAAEKPDVERAGAAAEPHAGEPEGKNQEGRPA